MIIWKYIILWQLSEGLSIILPALIFLFIRYSLKKSTHQMLLFFQTHIKLKLLFVTLLCEGISFFSLYNLMLTTFSIEVTYAHVLTWSIFILQLIPWALKYYEAYRYLSDKEESKKQDTAIYR